MRAVEDGSLDLDENLERLGNAGLGNVVALDYRLIGLDTADNIVGLDCQYLLKGVGSAVSLESPDFHLTETLAAELGFTAEGLLRNERVRAGGTCVNLIVNKVEQLEVIHDADGDGVIELSAGTSVVEYRLAVLSESRLLERFADILLVRAVEDGSLDLVAQMLRGKAEMHFEHLTDIHSGGNAQGVEHDIERRAVRKEGHILLRKYS